jgi:signal peptidase II
MDASRGILTGMALILVGAMGNIVDSMFYGLIFNESTFTSAASIFPDEGGYAPFLFGKVVDMLYFPLVDTTLPDWVPFWGGEHFIFFRPIFNIADSCITIGVGYLLIFHRKFFLR